MGYLVVPYDLVDAFVARLFAAMYPALLEQAVVAEFITAGHFARHIRRMRLLYYVPNPCIATKHVHAVFQDIDGVESKEFWGQVCLRQLGIFNAMAALLCVHEGRYPDRYALVVLATEPFSGALAL